MTGTPHPTIPHPPHVFARSAALSSVLLCPPAPLPAATPRVETRNAAAGLGEAAGAGGLECLKWQSRSQVHACALVELDLALERHEKPAGARGECLELRILRS